MFCKKNPTLRTVIQTIFITEQRCFLSTKPVEATKKFPKKSWTAEESKKLLQLVEEHGTNWKIIQQHFPDRGKKSVGGRYHFMRQKASGDVKDMMQNNASLPRSGKWTKEEDERLLSLTSEHGLLWTKFCQYFEYRTASDLLQRYTKLRGKSEQHTGLWTEFEKQKFDSLVSIHGRKFKHIALLMNTRTAEQCRARYSVISGKSTALSHLKTEQLDKLKEAVEKHGLDNFEQLVKEAVLPFTVSELDVRKYYRQELDPKIERTPWTKEELDTMIQLFKELDGRMDLVQSMLPKKRSLKDMWTQYEDYCDSQPTTASTTKNP